MSLPGAPRIEGYELLSVLGQGGMGCVYRARDRKLDRIVALKVLAYRQPPEPGERGAAEDRFRREIRIHCKLVHPYLARLYEADVQGDLVYLAMELVDGGSLRQVLDDGPLPFARARALAAQLAVGLAYLDQNGIVHRDLKPANVLVGRDGRARIVDLGLARDATSTVITLTGQMIGTLVYMAPETVRQDATGAPVDVYAAGLIFHELFAGALPYTANHPAHWMKVIVSDPPRPLRAFVPDVDPRLERLVLACLEKEAGDRPTAAELVAALCELWPDEPALRDVDGEGGAASGAERGSGRFGRSGRDAARGGHDAPASAHGRHESGRAARPGAGTAGAGPRAPRAPAHWIVARRAAVLAVCVALGSGVGVALLRRPPPDVSKSPVPSEGAFQLARTPEDSDPRQLARAEMLAAMRARALAARGAPAPVAPDVLAALGDRLATQEAGGVLALEHAADVVAVRVKEPAPAWLRINGAAVPGLAPDAAALLVRPGLNAVVWPAGPAPSFEIEIAPAQRRPAAAADLPPRLAGRGASARDASARGEHARALGEALALLDRLPERRQVGSLVAALSAQWALSRTAAGAGEPGAPPPGATASQLPAPSPGSPASPSASPLAGSAPQRPRGAASVEPTLREVVGPIADGAPPIAAPPSLERALASVCDAIEADAGEPELRALAARLLDALGEPAAARLAAEQAVLVAPERSVSWLRLADVLAVLARRGGAGAPSPADAQRARTIGRWLERLGERGSWIAQNPPSPGPAVTTPRVLAVRAVRELAARLCDAAAIAPAPEQAARHVNRVLDENPLDPGLRAVLEALLDDLTVPVRLRMAVWRDLGRLQEAAALVAFRGTGSPPWLRELIRTPFVSGLMSTSGGRSELWESPPDSELSDHEELDAVSGLLRYVRWLSWDLPPAGRARRGVPLLRVLTYKLNPLAVVRLEFDGLAGASAVRVGDALPGAERWELRLPVGVPRSGGRIVLRPGSLLGLDRPSFARVHRARLCREARPPLPGASGSPEPR